MAIKSLNNKNPPRPADEKKPVATVQNSVDQDKAHESEEGINFLHLSMFMNGPFSQNGFNSLDTDNDALGLYIPESFEVQDNASTIINGETVTANNFYSGSHRAGDFTSFEGVFRGGNFPGQNYDVSGFIPKISKASNIHADGTFQQAFAVVVASEGGFSNHKADRGGATIFGVASKANPAEYQQIMGLLSSGQKEAAMNLTMQVYKQKYWNKAGIDNISDPEARLVAFDAAINHGTGFARKMISRVGEDAEGMLRYRANAYIQIVENNPSQGVFMNGWRNRLAKFDSIISNDAAPTVQLASSEYKGGALGKSFQAADAIRLPAHTSTPAPKHTEQGIVATATSYASQIASSVSSYIPKFWS